MLRFMNHTTVLGSDGSFSLNPHQQANALPLSFGRLAATVPILRMRTGQARTVHYNG